MVERAFKELKVKSIFGTCNLDNLKSKRVMEKLGFKYYKDIEKIDDNNKKYKIIAMVLTNDDKI